MILGFTGARAGLTPLQLETLLDYLREMPICSRLHHGACVGADEQFALACRAILQGDEIIAHPGDIPSLTSAAALEASHVILPAKPCLERNRDIVDAVQAVYACPDGPERQRSGTWSTIRYSRKIGRRALIFWPDGSIAEASP